ncbi:hypothetical protein [Desulfonema limicola]|uniref:hypothetical protein n=1 Tax=Desulfonema limicola TaxID=45656 RepID=UPI001A9AC044|nr:hypothetical protein [Desulfonema limicola]
MDKSGKLDMEKLMSAFQDFFREHSQHWVERFQYKEAGPQLLLQAFLQLKLLYGACSGFTDNEIEGTLKAAAGECDLLEDKITEARQKRTIQEKIHYPEIHWHH